MAGSGSHETAVVACASSYGSSSYTTADDAAYDLRRQRSMPAAALAPRGDHHHWSMSIRSLGNGEFLRSQSAPAARGVGAAARALWAWVARRSRKKALLSRSGSSSAKERYGDEDDYAQNFDDGAAAMEPENLSRSFSARYAVGIRLDGTSAAVESGWLRTSRSSV